MTTTTNFEISKKLAEIGFSRQAFWVWTSKGCCCPFETYLDGFRAYDLETLLDALPKNYLVKNDWLECFLNRDFNGTKRLENESLADTAGRLLILLHEKNLIKF